MSSTRTSSTERYQDTPVDVKFVLSALWVTMLFVLAHVDIFASLRADVLEAALAGIALLSWRWPSPARAR